MLNVYGSAHFFLGVPDNSLALSVKFGLRTGLLAHRATVTVEHCCTTVVPEGCHLDETP
jgi:hypothetical protein